MLAHHGTILEGASAYDNRALLIADAHLQQPILRVGPGTTGYRIANVWFYGNKWNRVNPYCADHRVVNLRLFGSGFVVDNIESDTAPCQTSTTVDGGPFEIMNSWFAFNGWPEGEVPPECGRDDVVPSRCWADGLTVHLCNQGQIHDNHFLDNTDVDLIVGGAFECTVEDNTIVHSGTYGFAGLMVGWFPSSVEGIGDGDHTGSLYQRNTVTSSYDKLAFGVMVGFHPWDYRQPEQVTEAGQVYSNSTTGAVVNLAVDGIASGTVEANAPSGAQGTNAFGDCATGANYTAADFGVASLQPGWVSRWYHGGTCSP